MTVVDGKGEPVPRASHRIRFSVTGRTTSWSVDDGDPTSFEPFQASERSALNGLALIVLRTRARQAGQVVLEARAGGLRAARLSLSSAPLS